MNTECKGWYVLGQQERERRDRRGGLLHLLVPTIWIPPSLGWTGLLHCCATPLRILIAMATGCIVYADHGEEGGEAHV
jgi:hypothetical protein